MRIVKSLKDRPLRSTGGWRTRLEVDPKLLHVPLDHWLFGFLPECMKSWSRYGLRRYVEEEEEKKEEEDDKASSDAVGRRWFFVFKKNRNKTKASFFTVYI